MPLEDILFDCEEHMEKAAKRVEDWIELRYTYGFSEWYSNVYYVEDLFNGFSFCVVKYPAR